MNSKQQAAVQTRAHLIEAALNTLRQHGANNLTLDAVAKASAMSKGGLLHHFPTKEALIEALLRQLFTDYEQQVQGVYEREAEGVGRWLRAYIRTTFNIEEPLPMELLGMLLSAITEYPNLLRLVQVDHQQWEERLMSDGLPLARARAIRMAADSYWQERLIGIGARSAEERHDLVNELLNWAEAGK
jgi:AcrR family transcriptional regulator